jgi:threonine dehydrogenase-like Zn-dependent dehydrogenase
VTSIPILFTASGVRPIVYSNDVPAGYGERMLLSAPMITEVPNGLDVRHAALTEPMAVGVHAVAKSGLQQGDAAVVLGCGPIGLATIGALRIAGIELIVAADFSPARRELALHMGAHEAVDPKAEPAIDAWQRIDGQRPLVIFECVGVKGMLADAMAAAPPNARIAVAGVCMEPDTIQPLVGINKELTVQFCLGYTPEEFSDTLQRIASGDLDVAPLITGEVGIAGVPAAFEALRNPDEHAKILVEPALG